MSQTGQALLCGVTQPTISKLLSSSITFSEENPLKALLEEGLYLITWKREKSREIKIIRSSACFKIIRHYDRKGNKVAQATLDKFGAMGIDAWIQSITGWQNSTPSSPSQPQTPPPDAQPKSLSPAPGWKPEIWGKLPEEDKQHFSESKKQFDARLKRERADIDRFLDRCWYRRV